MKSLLAVIVLVFLFTSVPEFTLAECLTWKLGETTQGKSNISLQGRAPRPYKAEDVYCFESSYRKRYINISLKVKNHSGTVDVGPVHNKQTYLVQFSYDRCASSNTAERFHENTPVAVWVSSGEEKTSTRKLDTVALVGHGPGVTGENCVANLYLTVTNQNPGFPHLGRAEMELKLCQE